MSSCSTSGHSLYMFRHLITYFQRERPEIRSYFGGCWQLVMKWERLEPVEHRNPLPMVLLQAMASPVSALGLAACGRHSGPDFLWHGSAWRSPSGDTSGVAASRRPEPRRSFSCNVRGWIVVAGKKSQPRNPTAVFPCCDRHQIG
ncbi:unnamed protein product [Symbiodinium natans]|uniref:Uncharacterized protein n=1 Tax=Symbiodinium natans TaxID=878477 RepID=A0A812N0L9_9DINO|nr:unnamed protein product [Symbiodinium natans]